MFAHSSTAFISLNPLSVRPVYRQWQHPRCSVKPPTPPRDPSDIRTESEKRRNQPPKPMRRRRRRTTEAESLDWDRMPSVPLVRPDASPESGEDYWVDLEKSIESTGEVKKKAPKIDEELKSKLKEEVVSPYTQNWILRVFVVVLVLVILVAIFGGEDTVPIISIPDL